MTITYYTRQLFTIAEDKDLGISVSGIWYRHNPVEYWVFSPTGSSKGFTDRREALEYFETLNAYEIAKLDCTQPEHI